MVCSSRLVLALGGCWLVRVLAVWCGVLVLASDFCFDCLVLVVVWRWFVCDYLILVCLGG